MMLGRMYQDVKLKSGANLEDLWNYFQRSYAQLHEKDMKNIAGMAVNGTYVPRKRWKRHTLREEDRVDLISQMAGG
jgi:thiamine biosynthesis protein ThiS